MAKIGEKGVFILEKEHSNLGLGALFLLGSGIVCKFLGAFFRLPLTNLLGLEGIGVFQLIMALYTFALVATCGGMTISLSKLIGSARAKREYGKIKVYLLRAVFVGLLVGLLVGLAFFVFWKKISVLQGILSNRSYMLFVVLLPTGAIIAALRGYFQGYENMLPTATSQIVEQVIKFAFGLLFAYIFGKYGVESGVFGAFLGIVLSEVLTLVMLFVWYLCKKERYLTEMDSRPAKREFDRTNFLLVLSTATIPLANAIDGLVVVKRLVSSGLTTQLSTKLFGLQSGVVGAILNFPLIISVAITTAMLPNVSYIISKGTAKKGLVEKGLKILLVLILPTTLGLVAISKSLLPIFYTSVESEFLGLTFDLMLYGSFSIIFTAIMQYFVMLLQACGEFGFVLKTTAIGALLKVVITIALSGVGAINVFALVFGNIALSGFVCFCSVLKLKKKADFSVSLNEIFNLLFATTAMFFAVYSFLKCDYFGNVVNLVLSVFVGVVVYGIFIIPYLIKLFSKKKKNYV